MITSRKALPAPQIDTSEIEALVKQQLTTLGKALETRPFTAVALGIGLGFLAARLLGDRR